MALIKVKKPYKKQENINDLRIHCLSIKIDIPKITKVILDVYIFAKYCYKK